MVIFSQKLAKIILPIDKHSSHLNSQGQVVNSELTMKNMRYASEALYAFQDRNLIFRRQVTTQYIDQKSFPFEDIMFPACGKENTEKSIVLQ